MAFKCCGIWSAEEFKMWIGCALATALFMVITWTMYDGQVMLLYTSPLWATLLLFGPLLPANANPRAVPCVTFLIFIISTWWVKTLPEHCRSLWQQKLAFDDEWTASAMASALREHREELLPGVDTDDLDAWLVQHGLTTSSETERRLSEESDHDNDQGHVVTHSKVGATSTAPASKAMRSIKDFIWSNHETEHSGKANLSNVAGDNIPVPGAVHPFTLRTYCLYHAEDAMDTFPTTYVFLDPPDAWGPMIEEALNTTCDPWTCTFSEQHHSGRWAFISIFFAVICANVLHTSWTGMCALDVYMGAGKLRLWWMWVWAIFFPLWSTMYVTKINDFSVGDFYNHMFNVVWSTLFQFNQVLLCLGFLAVSFLIFNSRQSIYRSLGIDDHNVFHWLNLNRSVLSASRTIQLCVWRLDVSADDTLEEFRRWQGEPLLSTKMFREEDAPQASGGLLSWLTSNNGFEKLSAKETPRHVPFLRGAAPSFFVRIAWANNEIQNSRVQRLTAPVDVEDILYVQENFRLILESPKEDSRLYMEVRDQSLFKNTDLGRATLEVKQILYECSKAKDMKAKLESTGEELRGGSVATEQIMRMLEVSPGDAARLNAGEAERLRRRMYEVGFRPFELSEGGALWAAITELNPDTKDNGCHFLGC